MPSPPRTPAPTKGAAFPARYAKNTGAGLEPAAADTYVWNRGGEVFIQITAIRGFKATMKASAIGPPYAGRKFRHGHEGMVAIPPSHTSRSNPCRSPRRQRGVIP